MCFFNLTAFVLQDRTNFDRFYLFNAVYSSMLGDSNDYDTLASKDPWFLWIVHLIITIVLQIIALNLLISFIGGSYNKIIEIEDSAIIYEKLKLIMIYEARESQTERGKQSGYLYLVGSPGAFEKEEYLKGNSQATEEMKELTEKVNVIDSQVTTIIDKLEKLTNITEKIESKIFEKNK